jgi:hypothetical protein
VARAERRQAPFGGSLTAAIVAAGLEPARPGPRRRTDVDPEQAGRAVMSPEGRAMVEAALASARESARRVASLEAQLDRGRARALRLTEERDAARRAAAARPKVIRERAGDGAALRRALAAAGRAEAAEAAAGDRADAARADAARRGAWPSAWPRGSSGRRPRWRRFERSGVRFARSWTGRATGRGRSSGCWPMPARRRRRRPRSSTCARKAPAAAAAAAVRAASAEAAAARRAAEAAELRTARAERELRETVAAVRGEPRRLTPKELADLRDAGPSGPAVLAAALKDLSAARAGGGPTALAAALGQVARAAVSWRERI